MVEIHQETCPSIRNPQKSTLKQRGITLLSSFPRNKTTGICHTNLYPAQQRLRKAKVEINRRAHSSNAKAPSSNAESHSYPLPSQKNLQLSHQPLSSTTASRKGEGRNQQKSTLKQRGITLVSSSLAIKLASVTLTSIQHNSVYRRRRIFRQQREQL